MIAYWVVYTDGSNGWYSDAKAMVKATKSRKFVTIYFSPVL